MGWWYQTRLYRLSPESLLAGLCFLCLLFLCSTAGAEPLSARLQQTLQSQLDANAPLKTSTTTSTNATARFYEQRQWQPLWDNARLSSLLTQIRLLELDGLVPGDYFLAELEHFLKVEKDSRRSANREILATRAYLLALKHLYRGKVDPRLLDPHWNFDIPSIDVEAGLNQAREAVEKQQIKAAFQRARPTWPRYEKMREALASLRRQAQQGGWPVIPESVERKSLKPGMRDERVPLLRQRLQAAGLLVKTATGTTPAITPTKETVTTTDTPDTAIPSALADPAFFFDSDLENAVRRFQQNSYLEVDGAVGKQTLQQLNIPIEERIGQVRVNLERMRWYLREIKDDFVIVDVAGYKIAYLREGKVIWKSRVQVGKGFRKTPIFQSEISYLTLNPQWKIPPTIFRKDSLPAIRKNRSYLSKNHLRIIDNKGNPVSASSVNWSNPTGITLIQDARPDGALGQLAIRFPNPYSVYLHETPHQKLFEKEQRAFSSGCIRVENVRELGVLLLNDEVKWNREALELAFTEGKTRDVGLHKKIPILIAYWTADVDEEGLLSFRPDIYEQDILVLQALDGPLIQAKPVINSNPQAR